MNRNSFINYTVESMHTDYAATIEDLEDQFRDNIEEPQEFRVGTDYNGNAIYETEYTLTERQQMRREILERLDDIAVEIENLIDALQDSQSSVERLYEEVDAFDV